MRRIESGLAFFLFTLLTASAICSGQNTAQSPTSQSGSSASGSAGASSESATQETSPAAPGQQPPAGEQNKGQGSGDDKKGSDNSSTAATSNDRLFFTLPNFMTLENAGHVPPMTAGQKFKVVARSSFDPIQIVWYGFLAGISQAQNSEAGYGQGAAGYAKRFGASAADGTIENFTVGAILPSLLHQDPRYFQSGSGSFKHRTGYAVSRLFVTRSDAGHAQFNYSEIFGAAIAAGISTYSYHPREDRNLGNAASVWGSELGYDTLTLVVKEFWPDIRRKLKKQPH